VILREHGITIAVGLSYLVLHVLLYVCVLRYRTIFQSERGIFLYHFVSAALFTLVAFAAAITHFSDATLAIAAGLSAVHYIYSISFLELWSLAEGGYSLSILAGIASRGTLPRSALIDVFARLGDVKKGDRLSVLSKLSLAHRNGNFWRLSARGRSVAIIVNALIWLAAIEKGG
jgi:hypothetical protein